MNYPFEKTKKGHPILDTEEKLQWYMNRLLHREVDLYYVNAEVNDLETVRLKKRKTLLQATISSYGCAPTIEEPDLYGCVDRSVVPVLRAIHARCEAEMEAKRKEIGEKERELRNETSAIVKEFKKEMSRREDELWKTILGQ